MSDGSGFNEPVLNEVLSLNAQELCSFVLTSYANHFLNEVLSLNAQEFQQFAGGGMFSGPQ